MGQKVHPISFRLGGIEDWRSRWYARKKQFGGLVVADKRLRDFIKANYAFALISRIDIERTREEVRVTLYCGRPGVIIGRRGSEVDRLRSRLEEIVQQKVDINIVEIHHPEMDAQLVAEGIAEQLGQARLVQADGAQGRRDHHGRRSERRAHPHRRAAGRGGNVAARDGQHRLDPAAHAARAD